MGQKRILKMATKYEPQNRRWESYSSSTSTTWKKTKKQSKTKQNIRATSATY